MDNQRSRQSEAESARKTAELSSAKRELETMNHELQGQALRLGRFICPLADY